MTTLPADPALCPNPTAAKRDRIHQPIDLDVVEETGKRMICPVCKDEKARLVIYNDAPYLLVNNLLIPYIPVSICTLCGAAVYFTVKREPQPFVNKQNGGIEG
jgi:C4-type Zn-finger protein